MKIINRKKNNIAIVVVILILVNVNIMFGQREDLNILNKWIRWGNPGYMLINHLNKQAFDYLDIRDKEISRLKTKSDWLKRQQKVREILMGIVGPFPEKTPLNPKITGVVKKDGYIIEKVIYESMPNFYVTGCLFIPDRIKGKRPAILKVIGHTQESFRAKGWYQNVIQNLVKKGFIVFTIDPIGQGERVQYYNPKTKTSDVGYSALEHNYIAEQCFLSGISSAKYFIWDGIRAIDYLLTRKEVDIERIGVTGISGGGTITSYMCAFDDRISAGAPCNWSSVSRRLIESCGTHDSEANLYHEVVSGITFEDLIELRVPKPTLMVFTTRDYLNIQGAREAYQEIKRAYKSFGKEENLEFSEDDDKHAFTKKNKEAIYAFFQKHLNLPGDPTELKVDTLTPEELNITPTGQVSTYLGGESVFTFSKIETEKLIEKIEKSRKNIKKHLDFVKNKAQELSGYAVPYDKNEYVFCGRYQRNDYCVEMYILQDEKNYVIPLLLFVPKFGEKFPAVIYLHPKGKSVEAFFGGEIEKIVKMGYVVAAPDLLGIGETESSYYAFDTFGYNYTAIVIGRGVVGIQAGDIVRVTNFLKTRDNVNKEKIGAVAISEICPALLHAATFDNSINRIALINPLISYKSVAVNKFYNIGRIKHKIYKYFINNFSYAVAGALTAYDLPDLIGCVAPRKVLLVNLKNQMLEPASNELIEQELTFPRSVYSFKNAPENLKVVSQYENIDWIIDWCFE